MGKYGSFNTNPYSVHNKILRFIGERKKVLDVGCAEGNLSQQLNQCEVVGIELDVKSAQIAQKYCDEVIVGNVESIELPTSYYNYFDHIVFADVLEHLKEPLAVLTNFKKYLKDDGYIIVSLPNIANWRIRLNLLLGNFDYEDHGILDEGHLQFFTEKNAKKLILNAGLKIYQIDITIGDINRFAKLFHSIGLLWPKLLAYQFLIIAKKN